MNRSTFGSESVSLSHLLLSWLSPALSLFFLGCVMFALIRYHEKLECGITLKLFAQGRERPPIDAGSPTIDIIEGGAVKFNEEPCDPWDSKLAEGIRQHRDSAPEQEIVIRAEALARYERIIDVLNAFEKCDHHRYRLMILPLGALSP